MTWAEASVYIVLLVCVFGSIAGLAYLALRNNGGGGDDDR